MAHFETALTNFPDHPSAIVALSNILLDIYTEELSPPPAVPELVPPGTLTTPSASTLNTLSSSSTPTPTHNHQTKQSSHLPFVPNGPIGLPLPKTTARKVPESTTPTPSSGLEPNHNHSSSTELLDRLAARDRAYGLLSGLTKLGSGWNYSEAWFALARAYEEGGQPGKAREVLWWCVELEEARAVRDWRVVASGGYVL